MPQAPDPSTQAILMIEDSLEDYETTRRAFERSRIKNPLVHFETGDEALDYLKESDASTRPGVILLDLNLPGTDGHEILKTLKADPGLRHIPVVVLTTSDDERDVQSCYQEGANSYIRKPVDLHRFMDAITRLQEYWFEISIIPQRSGSDGRHS